MNLEIASRGIGLQHLLPIATTVMRGDHSAITPPLAWKNERSNVTFCKTCVCNRTEHQAVWTKISNINCSIDTYFDFGVRMVPQVWLEVFLAHALPQLLCAFHVVVLCADLDKWNRIWFANKDLVELELRTYLNLRTQPEIWSYELNLSEITLKYRKSEN